MRSTYRVLAIVLAAEVVLQATAIAYAIFGLSKYIDDGAVVDKASQESGETFEGVVGFIVHGINGMIVMPVLALALLLVSLGAGVVGGQRRAAILFGMVVVQVLLGMYGRALPALGALHGLNALGIFAMAVSAARSVQETPATATAPSAPVASA